MASPVARLILVFEDEDLVPAQVFDHLCDDARAVHKRRPDVRLAVPAEHQHPKLNRVADISGQPVNVEYLARLDPVLPAAGTYYCVNGIASVG